MDSDRCSRKHVVSPIACLADGLPGRFRNAAINISDGAIEIKVNDVGFVSRSHSSTSAEGQMRTSFDTMSPLHNAGSRLGSLHSIPAHASSSKIPHPGSNEGPAPENWGNRTFV